MIQAVNTCIRKNYKNGTFIIRQEEIINEFIHLYRWIDDSINKQVIIEKQWLDFEPIFSMYWKVEYEKPSRGDSDFEPYFKFTPRK